MGLMPMEGKIKQERFEYVNINKLPLCGLKCALKFHVIKFFISKVLKSTFYLCAYFVAEAISLCLFSTFQVNYCSENGNYVNHTC